MKRFLVFAWDLHNALGGMDDFEGSFDSLPEAEEFGRSLSLSVVQVVDQNTTLDLLSPGEAMKDE